MNIIKLYNDLKSNYKSYLESFVNIKDQRIKDCVDDSMRTDKLWPKALIQFNPNYEKGLDVKELIASGFPIHKELELFFSNAFYKHQQEALEIDRKSVV